jgi:hypothetical protein
VKTANVATGTEKYGRFPAVQIVNQRPVRDLDVEKMIHTKKIKHHSKLPKPSRLLYFIVSKRSNIRNNVLRKPHKLDRLNRAQNRRSSSDSFLGSLVPARLSDAHFE